MYPDRAPLHGQRWSKDAHPHPHPSPSPLTLTPRPHPHLTPHPEQKWSKGKVKEKLQNQVLFDKATYEVTARS